MAKTDLTFSDINALEDLARGESCIHRLDPRSKLLTTILFVVTVVSFGRFEVAALVPLFLFPVVLAALGGVPWGLIGRRILLVAPFALGVGLFNPWLERSVQIPFGEITLSAGWVSFASIALRVVLTLSAALILMGTTSFPALCQGMERLGAPRVFTVQLLFLHRYLFVLGDEARRMVRARSLRSFGGRGSSLRIYASMLGQLLLRTLGRAGRIHQAMLSRGFTGEITLTNRPRLRLADAGFLLGWGAFFLAVRLTNAPHWLGGVLTELTR